MNSEFCWWVNDHPGEGWVRCDESANGPDGFCQYHRELLARLVLEKSCPKCRRAVSWCLCRRN